jgi:hypothetical protein
MTSNIAQNSTNNNQKSPPIHNEHENPRNSHEYEQVTSHRPKAPHTGMIDRYVYHHE